MRSYLLAASLIVTALVTMKSSNPAKAANLDATVATYAHGVLNTSIPYDLPSPGSGQLTVEILDPEDRPVGHVEHQVEVKPGRGSWQADIKLAKAIDTDELVWHRLRYRFAYADRNGAAVEGTESISQILRMPVVHILGQQTYLTGGQAAVRVIVTDSKNESVSGASSLRIELLTPGQKSRPLFTGPLDRRGTAEAQFRMPAGLTGNY